jgi:cytochrome P450
MTSAYRKQKMLSRGLLSDICVLSRLQRRSLSEVVHAELNAVRACSAACEYQYRQVFRLDKENGHSLDLHARRFIAQAIRQWETDPGPSNPLYVPLLTTIERLCAISSIHLVRWVLDDPNTFERASALESFAAAFDLQSVFTTKDRRLGYDLKRYFTGRTNGLSSNQLGTLMDALERCVDTMISTLDDKAAVPFIAKVEGMVLDAYAQSFFDMPPFPHAEDCAILVKKIWRLKSLRNNIPWFRWSPLHYAQMRWMQRRLFRIIADAQTLAAHVGSAAANEMAKVYVANGYNPGNLLNALIPLYEAISRGVVYAMIALASASSVQEELRREIEQHRNDALQYCMSKNTLLHRVWQETLRLWPPTPNQTRRVAGTGNALFPTGSKVVIAWSIFHMDPQVWGPGVENFDPTRWLHLTTDQERNYNPFGSGEQRCVAMDYASLGGRIILRRIIETRILQLPEGAPALAIFGTDRGYSRGPNPNESLLRFRQLA